LTTFTESQGRKVLIFRNQFISVEDFSAFGTVFGVAQEHHVRAMRHPKIPTGGRFSFLNR
jgi:hypothetical protein